MVGVIGDYRGLFKANLLGLLVTGFTVHAISLTSTITDYKDVSAFCHSLLRVCH